MQSFRIGETAAIPGSCSYAAASGNSKIIWISRITPFTPQPHFYLLPAPIFLNFIKLHFTHISPFLSQYSPPRNSCPEVFTRLILEASQGSNLSQILELDACIISLHQAPTHTLTCALFYIWLSTLPGQSFVHIIGKMCRRVPISGPFSHIPFSVCTKFSHIVPHIQSVGTVSMEGNCDWGQFSFAWSSNWSRPRNNLSHRPIVRLSSRATQLEGKNCPKMGLKMTSCPDEKAQQHLTQWVVTSALAPTRHMSRSVST